MSANLFDLLGKAIPVLETFANFTATDADNKAVAFLKAVYESPALLNWLESLFNAAVSTDGVLSLSTAAPEALVEELGARKFDWAKVVEMLPTIIALLKAFSGK